MKIWKEGQQVVIEIPGKVRQEFITSLHTRMEFNEDNSIVTIRDIGYNSKYVNDVTGAPLQESFSCAVSELRNESNTLVGNYAAVRTYLLTFIGS